MEAISRMRWTFALTYARFAPHWYVRRHDCDQRDFRLLFEAVQASEHVERFGGVLYRYLRPDDGYKYWVMTDDIRKAIIINRAKVEGST